MSEWTLAELGDLAELKMGQSPPSSLVSELRDGLPFLQGNAEFSVQSPQPRYQCDEAPQKAEPGDSLISVRAPVGTVNVADQAYGIGRGLAAVRFTTLTERFGYLSLQQAAVLLDRVCQGTTFTAIGRSELASLPLPVPTLEEQRQIADILDTLDETIQSTERVIAKQVPVRDGLACDLFNELALSRYSPPGTDQVLLRECGTWLSGGTPNTSNPRYWDGDIPWITSRSLRERYLSASSRCLTLAGVQAGSRIVPSGTILFVVRGMSLKSEFRVGLTTRSLAFGQDCKAIVPTDGIMPEYLLFALEAAEAEILAMVDEASHGTDRLQTSRLGSLKMLVPPWAKQRRIVQILGDVDKAISTNQEQLSKLRLLRTGIAADLLSGRVRTVAE